QTSDPRSRAVAPELIDARQLRCIDGVCFERAVARWREYERLVKRAVSCLDRGHRTLTRLDRLGRGRTRRRSLMWLRGTRLAPISVGPTFEPRGRHLILANACRAGEEELRERLIEDRRVGQRSAQNGPKRVTYSLFV